MSNNLKEKERLSLGSANEKYLDYKIYAEERAFIIGGCIVSICTGSGIALAIQVFKAIKCLF